MTQNMIVNGTRRIENPYGPGQLIGTTVGSVANFVRKHADDKCIGFGVIAL